MAIFTFYMPPTGRDTGTDTGVWFNIVKMPGRGEVNVQDDTIDCIVQYQVNNIDTSLSLEGTSLQTRKSLKKAIDPRFNFLRKSFTVNRVFPELKRSKGGQASLYFSVTRYDVCALSEFSFTQLF